jgi:hypothetical protein
MTNSNGKNALAKVGDPLVAPNGDVIEPEEDEDVSFNSLPPASTAVPFKAYRPIARRVLSDLRAPPQAINVALVVLGHTLLGISDSEICEATGLSAQDVNKVRDSRIYTESFSNIMQELINANSEYIECRLASYSGAALNNIAGIAMTAKSKTLKFHASKDLLDRAGHRPQDQAARTNQGMNELHIVITSPSDSVQTKIDFKSNGHAKED